MLNLSLQRWCGRIENSEFIGSQSLKQHADQDKCYADIKGEVDFSPFAKNEECENDGVAWLKSVGESYGKGRKAFQSLNLKQVHANGAKQCVTKHQPKIHSFGDNYDSLLSREE